ncbi:MAG TPA: hypothetical protein VFT87_01245, partial [Candidatus Saccharimonadales bacterium]|nr:hypothetical protein [Candidatus Saccharimonadales bacterium]
ALIATTEQGLQWLYKQAAQWGATPLFEPTFDWKDPLLLRPTSKKLNDRRDAAFIELDSVEALEVLCRCASVQVTFSVNPNDAVAILNRLWAAKLHTNDYPNDVYWRRYIALSRAKYNTERYAGPESFASLEDYASYIARQPIHMYNGQRCNPPLSIGVLGNAPNALALALRNVWNHYRLKRFGDTLAIEARPFARRHDQKIATTVQQIKSIVQP